MKEPACFVPVLVSSLVAVGAVAAPKIHEMYLVQMWPAPCLFHAAFGRRGPGDALCERRTHSPAWFLCCHAIYGLVVALRGVARPGRRALRAVAALAPANSVVALLGIPVGAILVNLAVSVADLLVLSAAESPVFATRVAAAAAAAAAGGWLLAAVRDLEKTFRALPEANWSLVDTKRD